MNQYTFDLIAQHRPEVLERVLRVIRLRGFTVTNMEMALVETQVQLKITVKSDRTFDGCTGWRKMHYGLGPGLTYRC